MKFRALNACVVGSFVTGLLGIAACSVDGLDAGDPQRGPGELVPEEDVSDEDAWGGSDPVPAPRDAPIVGGDCDLECRSYCDSLNLQNPVNDGICSKMWGVGIASRPIDRKQACRRLYIDTIGRFPTPGEQNDVCNRPTWGETVRVLVESDEFVKVNQRRWADEFLYNNEAVSIERIYDLDALVEKTYRGRVPFDLFATVASTHPVLTRRLDTPGDRAERVFKMFLGRPPYPNERSDLGRLFNVWANDYWDHPYIGTLPDAYLRFPCVDEQGNADPALAGDCTSVLWGYNPLIMEPDNQRLNSEGLMWSGYLSAYEWEQVQLPGRILASRPEFWEAAVDRVMMRYFGYDMGTEAPEVRRKMEQYLLEHNGDVRAAHFAVLTSIPYLQSSQGGLNDEFPYTEGPLKQIEVEPWLDSIKVTTGYEMATCDHRMTRPSLYLEDESTNAWARALVRNSEWTLNEDGDGVVGDYRGIAQTLGGCPTNEIGGRFTTVSILNTAVQESFIAGVCGLTGDRGVAASALLPDGTDARTALNDDVARDIITTGNTSAASIPLAMDRMLASGEIHEGGNALLVGFGAGLVFASEVVTLP